MLRDISLEGRTWRMWISKILDCALQFILAHQSACWHALPWLLRPLQQCITSALCRLL